MAPFPIPEFALKDLEANTCAISDWAAPFIVRTGHGISSENGLEIFAQHQHLRDGDCVHFVQHFDIAGRYVRDREFSPISFANAVRSGEAHCHDLYWAYYNAGDTTLRSSGPAQLFHRVRTALGTNNFERSNLTAWAGTSAHVEPLHYDDCDNLHMVVCGRKIWKIFPPSAICWLDYVSCFDALMSRLLTGDMPPAGPDGKNLQGGVAMARGASPRTGAICVELKAGDALFLPAGWHHEVKSCGESDNSGCLDFTFALNHFFSTPLPHLCLNRRRHCCSWFTVARLRAFSWMLQD